MLDDFTQIMTPFDLSLSSPTLQITKLLIPFLPPNTQRMMAIYIKFMELQNALTSFSSIHNDNEDPLDALEKILPASAKETYDNVMNLMNMMQFMNEMNDDIDPRSMMTNMFDTTQKEGAPE